MLSVQYFLLFIYFSYLFNSQCDNNNEVTKMVGFRSGSLGIYNCWSHRYAYVHKEKRQKRLKWISQEYNRQNELEVHILRLLETYRDCFHDFNALILGITAVDDDSKKTEQISTENIDMVNIVQSDHGINKGGLVSNHKHLGDTEVIEIIDNIYYETIENDDKAK